MRKLSPLIATALLVVTAVAVRVRPSGTIGPIPGNPVSGVWPTLAVTAALVVAIIATTAGAVSLARTPRTAGDLPRVPPFERPKLRIRLSYLWLAIVALAIALVVFPLARKRLAPEATETPVQPSTGAGSTPQTPTETIPAPDDTGSPTFAVIALMIVGALSVAVLIATWRTARRQRALESEEPLQPEAPTSESLIRATKLALLEVEDPHRPPRESIIACFATMEHALGRTAFAPHDSDTAKEVIDRAVAHGLMPTEPANTLRSLFTEARFSPHEMTANHQVEAKTALNDALGGLQR